MKVYEVLALGQTAPYSVHIRTSADLRIRSRTSGNTASGHGGNVYQVSVVEQYGIVSN